MLSKFTTLKIILCLGVLDALSIALLIVFYLTGVDSLYLVNLNFLMITVVLFLSTGGRVTPTLMRNKFVLISLFFIVVSIIKLLVTISGDYALNTRFAFTHFYLLINALLTFIFVCSFSRKDYPRVVRIFKQYALYYLILSGGLLSIYSILYFSGKISYFGMGSNLHYALPFFMRGSVWALFFLVIVVSGKRAVLVNYLAQLIMLSFHFFRTRVALSATGFMLLSVFFVCMAYWTDLFYRFEGTFDVDFEDNYSLLVAFGGRFEEAVGIYDFFSAFPEKLLFGSSPGESYRWVVSSVNWYTGQETDSYDELKNYSHVTPFSLLFRYGFVYALGFYLYGAYLVVRYYSINAEFYLVYIGILSSSFFGANLLSDPMAWVFLAFFTRYRKIYKC